MKADLREHLGKVVRHAWIAWAYTQDNPKASWLIEWEALPEADKEADRQIAEAVINAFLETLRQANSQSIKENQAPY